MTDAESLLAVLGVVYLAECAHWVPRQVVAFRALAGGRCRAVAPGSLFGNDSGGILFGNPLPPLGSVFLSSGWPLSLSPDAVLSHVATAYNPGGRTAQPAEVVAWDDIRAVTGSGREVRVNGRRFVAVGSEALARDLAALLRRLALLNRSERAPAIEQALAASLDGDAALARVAAFRRESRRVRALGIALLGNVFVVGPAMVLALGFAASWMVLLGVLVALTTVNVVWFRRAERRLHPGRSVFAHLVAMSISPLGAIRATDALSADLLFSFHPVAVARTLLSSGDYADFARRVLLDLRHPIAPVCPNEEPLAVATETWFRERFGAAMERAICASGLDPEELVRPPQPEDGCRAYCPRCRVQVTAAEGTCSDCGLALEEFARCE